MNFLPIAARELRVAARKRSTYRVRVGGAITAVVLGIGCMVLGSLGGGGATTMGRVLFGILSWLCLAAGLSAGLFFTSDALSEEKREGTLGLLFLTDLRGYDVAAGKLMATSLRGFYALLAVLPIIAVTLLMGGITGAQYGKSCLALVNALVLSLAAGMLISAFSRDSQKALAATLLVMLLLGFGGPITDATTAGLKHARFVPVWSLASPAYVLASASAWGRTPYWQALVINQVVAWSMLLAACIAVPHTWQERGRGSIGISPRTAYWLKYGGRRRRERQRTVLERDPMAWLAARERWQSLGLWVIALIVTGGFVFGLLRHIPIEAWMTWTYIGGFFTLLLYLATASLACRFFVEARRSGLLELLLVSPLNESQIVRGQWRALLRMFGLPVLLLLAVQVTGATLSQVAWLGMTAQTGAAIGAAATNASPAGVVTTTNISGTSNTTLTYSVTVGTSVPAATMATMRRRPHEVLVVVVAAGSAALRTGANLVALIWFGLWMGLTSRSANLATLRTILFVQVIPWFVITFASSIVFAFILGTAFRGPGPPVWAVSWWPLVNALIGTVLATAKDIGFVAWSRKRFCCALRVQATRTPGEGKTPSSKSW